MKEKRDQAEYAVMRKEFDFKSEVLMKTLAKVKFLKSKEGRELLFVPVRINGKGPFEFILDTGAAYVCLSRETAGALGLKSRRAKKAWTTDGLVDSKIAKVRSISIGRAIRRNLDVHIMDFTGMGLPSKLKRRTDGIIGIEFFEKYRMTIDCSNSEMILQKKS